MAGNQFLSAIDWPQCFHEYTSRYPKQTFSRLFQTIINSKIDITGGTFKAAPTASLFIKTFKTKLEGKENDWNMQAEHDASEFVVSLVGNITMRSREDPKAFLNKMIH